MLELKKENEKKMESKKNASKYPETKENSLGLMIWC